MVFGIDLDKSCSLKQKFDSIAVGHIFSLGRRSMAANQLGLTDGLHQSLLGVLPRARPAFSFSYVVAMGSLDAAANIVFSRTAVVFRLLAFFGSEWVKVECLIGGDRGFGQAVGRGSL